VVSFPVLAQTHPSDIMVSWREVLMRFVVEIRTPNRERSLHRFDLGSGHKAESLN
jgi:hypothetical protein